MKKSIENSVYKKSLGRWILSILIVGVTAVLLSLHPGARVPFGETIGSYIMEMASIFPAVLILMGLLTVFVSSDFISRHMGQNSGLRGFAVSLLLGTLPTGPLYVAFPLAATFRKKGARIANLVIFLSAWACIKFPQELVELRFLGPRFMLSRLILTVVLVLVIALVVEKFDKRSLLGSESVTIP